MHMLEEEAQKWKKKAGDLEILLDHAKKNLQSSESTGVEKIEK